MNTREKSLKLAELMGWDVTEGDDLYGVTRNWVDAFAGHEEMSAFLNPYVKTETGLAQFAAILLKFPEVMERFNCVNEMRNKWDINPTQANILDEVLRLNNVKID